MKLVDVYCVPEATKILYDLLEERDPVANISHQSMPSWQDHCEFVRSLPYREWFLIENDTGKFVGACYLSRMNEIGVAVFRQFQGRGYATFAVQSLIYRHADERLLANIAPANEVSHRMFQKMGFRLIQYTYEWRNPEENKE